MGKTCFEGPGLLVIFALPSSSKEYDFIVQLFGFFSMGTIFKHSDRLSQKFSLCFNPQGLDRRRRLRLSEAKNDRCFHVDEATKGLQKTAPCSSEDWLRSDRIAKDEGLQKSASSSSEDWLRSGRNCRGRLSKT